jgi:DNA-binding NtrC family response regulator
MKLAQSYPWPGNVRELQNAIERAVVLCAGSNISETDLPAEIRKQAASPEDAPVQSPVVNNILPLAEATYAFQRALVRRALEAVDGNQTQAAKLLDLPPSNLSRLMRRLGLR